MNPADLRYLHRASYGHEHCGMNRTDGLYGDSIELPVDTRVELIREVFDEVTAERFGRRWLARTVDQIAGRQWWVYVSRSQIDTGPKPVPPPELPPESSSDAAIALDSDGAAVQSSAP